MGTQIMTQQDDARLESVTVRDRFNHWNTEPWTLGRVVEAMARQSLAVLVGLGVSLLILHFAGEKMLTGMGMVLPAAALMMWVMPDD